MSRKSSSVSAPNGAAVIRCAIYTRKSSEEGLEQEFNSLDAQREACEAYIRSRRPDRHGRRLQGRPADALAA
jgi:hypothetical protein